MSAKAKSDPLISALIAKLPSGDKDWPVDRQLAWLNLMAMAFGAVYGGDAAARLGIRVDGSAHVASPAAAGSAAPAAPVVKPKPVYPFIIDHDNVAKNGKTKKPVLANEVTDTLFDLRGMDGDMKTIVWADGSTGLNGADLSIVAA